MQEQPASPEDLERFAAWLSGGGASEIIGLLFKTVPVRVQAHGEELIKAALGALYARKAVSRRHSHVNLTRLEQITGHCPVFDTLFSV